MRIYRIDVLMRFIWDEGRDMLAIRKIIVDQDLTLFGPFNEIAGHKDFFGVFHYYLMLPALWLADFDPTGPALFTAGLGVAAVGLIYYWVKLWQKESVALGVASLMAVAPLAVRFNQWAWNPNTVSFFAALYLISIWFYQNRPHKIGWAAFAGLMLGLLFQLHYFSAAVGIIGLAIFLKQTKKDWLGAILFVGAAVLPNLTFVLFDLTHEGFYRQIIFESLFGQTQQKFVVVSLVSMIKTALAYLLEIGTKLTGSVFLAWPLLGVWLVYAYRQLKNFIDNFKTGTYVQEDAQLVLSWLIFLLGTSIFPALLDDYHSAVLWPSLALVTIYFLRHHWPKKWFLLLFLILSWLIYANQFWRPPTWMENMPRLRRTGLAVASDAKLQANPNLNVASFVDPETRAIRFRYFIDTAEVTMLSFDDYPRTEILYAITPHDWPTTAQNPAWELDTFRQASATAIWQEDDWTIYRIEK